MLGALQDSIHETYLSAVRERINKSAVRVTPETQKPDIFVASLAGCKAKPERANAMRFRFADGGPSALP